MRWKGMISTLVLMLAVGAAVYGGLYAGLRRTGHPAPQPPPSPPLPSVPGREDPSTIIAYVNQKPVTYREVIEVATASDERPAGTGQTDGSEQALADFEYRQFAVKVVQLLRDDAIAMRGIDATAEEIRKESAMRLAAMGVDENVYARTVADLSASREALQAWLGSPEKADEIYEKFLAPRAIPRAQWDALRARHDTPEKVASLWVPRTPEDLRNASQLAIKSVVQRKKLLDQVNGEPVVVSDGEMADAWNRMTEAVGTSRPLNDERTQALLRYTLLQQKRDRIERAWVARQCQGGAVEVKVARFKKTIENLSKLEAQPDAPASPSPPATT